LAIVQPSSILTCITGSGWIASLYGWVGKDRVGAETGAAADG
jgi:hypothetical protein